MLEAIHLVNDTGTPGDLVTSDLQVAGTVTGGEAGSWVEIQFDHFADGTVNGSVYAYSSGQECSYDPRAQDYSLSGYSGSFTLSYRAIERDGMMNVVSEGPWQSFTVTVPAPPQMAVQYVDSYGYPTELSDGWGSVSFETTIGSAVTKTFTVQNLGGSDLTLDSWISLPWGFSLVAAPVRRWPPARRPPSRFSWTPIARGRLPPAARSRWGTTTRHTVRSTSI